MISRSGLEKRAEREAACAEMGVSMARFLRGRLERGSAEVGIDSGMFSDILCVPGQQNLKVSVVFLIAVLSVEGVEYVSRGSAVVVVVVWWFWV